METEFSQFLAEEDAKITELNELCEKGKKEMALIIQTIEGGKNQEVNDLIIKYATLENKTFVEFYRFLLAEMKEYLAYLMETPSNEPEVKQRKKENRKRFMGFERKYEEIVHFDISKIPTVSEDTKKTVKEVLPKE
ncbi:MAG: hypothetical protein PHS92_03925 [Candidatus Gracilibacteria bacterium]|nr:hypothetical protein [Candidatus Gracilibacteria bacterium]